jgi:hypothetical protein
MEKEILEEIRQLRYAITKILGTSDKPHDEQFPIEVLDQAEKEYQKLCIERGEWVEEYNIDKVIKSASWRAGKFIREHFQFTNYYKKGKAHYYNKTDLKKLGEELKKRNIDLSRYIELLESEDKFRLQVAKAKDNMKEQTVTFIVPDDVQDITSTPPKPPARDIIKQDIKNLKRQFRQNNFDDYIDIYRDRHAMMKHIYYFDKYIEPGKKSQCNKWIRDFNYANDALSKVKELEKERASLGLDNKESQKQEGSKIEIQKT